MANLSIIFAGTPDFAVPALQALLKDTSYSVCAVYTQPDKPSGRGRKLTASPIKQLAETYHIPVYQPNSLKDPHAQEELARLKADLMIVAAYGLILPKVVLAMPRLGCINIHASLLPRWRGASPIQKSILSGDKISGISIMQMEAGLDTGPIFAQQTCPILADDTSQTLHDRLAQLGAKTLLEILPKIERQQLTAQAQPQMGVTYAGKIIKEDAQLDWSQPALQLYRAIRAYNPWPIAFTYLNGHLIRIWDALPIEEINRPSEKQPEPGTLIQVTKQGIDVATGLGVLRITKAQLPGSKILSVADLLNAQRHEFQINRQFSSAGLK